MILHIEQFSALTSYAHRKQLSASYCS